MHQNEHSWPKLKIMEPNESENAHFKLNNKNN